ncbi:MAG: bifunctional 3-hydroxydecanoyl-ACP dehydratase/trans-2-decenoyl-ACP isomerase [Xanthomonadaceae bacterium]|nr:bifunctional 3-hydroxydecanoyl-ACP dehydratase/trans-2-decenoyl-ACP isomerase [Xanthomonadaceae bacterium]MDP2185863.1 bifunctional 3-hydroxydecanoyl-ACP dehydratase/trans-2-decenoyl-ACP isomerase [Xanthomonadales bacterium]MDZ4117224.1 bifunctional 3-hydroxydecanoyl-ACP dehydratase/trans-2-decenoyl-ACP isomerase [Xanthomonadaceae bacterium]MDZ4378838.1 bifunctional 3-hydroxydecanoyl-ACP dehydratase/trans-2-decenoyl-ACP isomerase [Xanthomonadaceae bacterium]
MSLMSYADFLKAQTLSKPELLAWGKQSLVSDAPGTIPSLPLPPMLMFDRITQIEHNGRRGQIVAEQDIHLDAWYFLCHFSNDPVQPGCLGVDAIWQLLGMYCALRGALGAGRALGCKEVDFFGQIRPHDGVVTYTVNVRRYSQMQGGAVVIGDGSVSVDGEAIYCVRDAKVGIYPGIQYNDYPAPSANSKGGVLNK